MSSRSSHKIKSRKKANDIFITPLQLAKINIEMIDYKKDQVIFNPTFILVSITIVFNS